MNMYKRIVYLLVSLLLLSQAQLSAHTVTEQKQCIKHFDSKVKSDSTGGCLLLQQDMRIKELLKLNRYINSKKKGFYGFRIQIYSKSSIDSSIDQAQSYKATFENNFPDLKVYLNYFDPDFKIRVGNFRDKIECESIIVKIKEFYPSCYTVRCFIPFRDFLTLSRNEFIDTQVVKTDTIQNIN